MAFESRKLQAAMRVIHLWLGIVAGLFIVMMGLSGTVIIFRSQIEDSIAPRVTNTVANGSPASLDVMAKNLDAIWPGARITRVTFPESADRPLLVQADGAGLAANPRNRAMKRMLLFFDPWSGQALGEKRTLAWLDWIVDLHQNLLSGKTGRAWTGAIGAGLFLMSATGLFSWLAGSRDWKRTLALPRKGPWRRVNFHAHKWAGLWTNVLLIVVSSTGMVLAWPDAFQQAIRTVTSEHAVVRPKPSNGDRRTGKSLLPLDEYLRAATTALPGGVVREMRLASRGSNAVSLTVWTSSDIRRKGGNIVLLDPVSARVISVERVSAAPLSAKFVELANAIHKTELGGLSVQLAWSLLGLAPTLLFVSGVGIWWQRRQAGKRRPPLRARTESDTIGTAVLVEK
jgi:uncharacterized iron-regulated membrane protein